MLLCPPTTDPASADAIGSDPRPSGTTRSRPGPRRRRRVGDLASAMVDGSSLAVVRIVYGAVGVLSMARILANGWVRTLYAGPPRHFTYPGFAWVRPPSVGWMYVLVVAVGVASACVAFGRWFRPAMAVLIVGFCWIELIDVSTYLNHYWFMTLAGALMLVAPMTSAGRPVARGWIWLLRSQIAVVYAFAGIAKLHPDWLLHAMPLRLWLPTRTDVPLIGPLLAEPWVAHAMSWAGAAFDCTIVAFLCWRRTRLAAWCAVVAFHVVTWRLFAIGVFPWLMIGCTTVFFHPAWPTRWVRRWRVLGGADAKAGGADAKAGGTNASDADAGDTGDADARADAASGRGGGRRFLVGLAAAWVAIQVLIPVRHVVIAGDARWTGEGYRWSWNVLATERGGDVAFRVTERSTGRTWTDDARELYTPLQWKVMSTDAELIRQAAHEIARIQRAAGIDVIVRADAFVSLNGRPAARLIDPAVDLASQPWRPGHQPWILPAPSESPP